MRSFQPVFQRDRIVVILVACGVEERDRLVFGSLAQLRGGVFAGSSLSSRA